MSTLELLIKSFPKLDPNQWEISDYYDNGEVMEWVWPKGEMGSPLIGFKQHPSGLWTVDVFGSYVELFSTAKQAVEGIKNKLNQLV